MSAPLVLTTDDLYNLARGLDALSRARREHGISPGLYDCGITVTAFEDDITLRVEWRTVADVEQFVIVDRYGS